MQSNDRSSNDDSDRRSMWKVWAPAILLAVIGIAITIPFLGDPPPRVIDVATGPAGGGYATAGQRLAASLADDGITVNVRETAGSEENLELLRENAVDLAFVQGGVYRAEDFADDEREPPLGIASLYFEPLFVFTRGSEERSQLRDLAGLRVQVGAEGSGTRAVSLDLLEACGALPTGDDLQSASPREAVDALLAGESDAVFLVTSPASALILELFEAEDRGEIRALSLERAHALTRHFRYLRELDLTRGMIDLDQDLPSDPVSIVAPTAGLIGPADLHPALVPLIIGALEEHYRRGQLFEKEGEFPSATGLDLPVGLAAERYYANGRSFLYRIFPFQLAASLDRLKILLLPLVTLLLPLIKLAPPLYRWRVRSRIFRWYQKVMQIEARLREDPSAEEFARAESELEELDAELRVVTVPLSYAEELYNLRMHTRLVRKDVEARLHGSES